jgi:hypothetical protein
MLRRALLRVIFALLLAAPGCSSADEPGFVCGKPPNTVDCKAEEVCVAKEYGTSRTWECVANPCGDAALSCEKCAAPACGGFICGSAKGRLVSCYCLSC